MCGCVPVCVSKDWMRALEFERACECLFVFAEAGADKDIRLSLSHAAVRGDAAPRRLSKRPLGGGCGAAGEGRRRGGEDECEHRARLLSVHLANSYTCRMRMVTFRGCTIICIPNLLSLKAALRLRGLSTVANNTSLGQSDSLATNLASPQRVMVHKKSLERVQDIGSDPSVTSLRAGEHPGLGTTEAS
jgi:hypothetical protein